VDDTYAEVGTEVILGKHTHKPWHTPIDTRNQDVVLYWRPEKEEYVGKKAKITKVVGRDWSGCLCCRVDIAPTSLEFRVESMILASEEEILRKNG
jgi:hypothetical protein